MDNSDHSNNNTGDSPVADHSSGGGGGGGGTSSTGGGGNNTLATSGSAAATSAAAFEPDSGTKMSLLLRPPGIPLNMESTCMALNERIVAAESCCFISMVSACCC